MDSEVNVSEKFELCAICLEEVETPFKPYNCNHLYHPKCIEILEKSSCKMKSKCSLCMAYKLKKNNSIEYNNYNLNNLLDNSIDVQYYINKWPDKKCFECNHYFNLETLGDWFMDNSNELKMNFKIMHINCKNCKKEYLIK